MRTIFIIMFFILPLVVAQAAPAPHKLPIRSAATPAPANNPQIPANQRLLNQGQQLEQRGKYEDALAVYEQFKTNYPTDPNGWLSVGRILGRLRKYDELEKLWQEFLPNAPGSIRVQIEAELGALKWVKKDFTSARTHWENAVAENRTDQGYNAVYNVMMNYGIHDEAVKLLLEGRKVFNNPNLFTYQLFQLYLITMNPKDAAAEASRQVIENPITESQWTFWLTQFGSDSGTVNALNNEFEKADKSTTNRAAKAAFAGLKATIDFHAQRFNDAVRETIIADSLGNTIGTRLINLTQQLLSEGETASARIALETAMRRQKSENPQTLSLLARLEWQQGDSVKAREHWKLLIDRFPNETDAEIAAQQLARSTVATDPQTAMQWLDKALKHPNAQHAAETRVLMIQVLQSMGKLTQAETVRNDGMRTPAPDLQNWSGTLMLLGFINTVLGTAPDSIVTQNIVMMDGMAFNDIASVDGMRWRILWNTVLKRPALTSLLRQGEREYVFHQPLTVLGEIEQALSPYDDASRELAARVTVWTTGSPEREKWIDLLLAHFPNEARLASLLLERAQERFKRGLQADANKDLEYILQAYPGRPEEEQARKLMRMWSKEG